MTHLYFTGFECLGCRAAYAPDQDLLLCPRCHQLLEARYDLARFGREVDRDALARRSAGVWRWRDLLPVRDSARIVTLSEGGTPFLRCACSPRRAS
jgi:threonine synthase